MTCLPGWKESGEAAADVQIETMRMPCAKSHVRIWDQETNDRQVSQQNTPRLHKALALKKLFRDQSFSRTCLRNINVGLKSDKCHAEL